MAKTKKQKKLLRAFKCLNELYSNIPDTVGCMDHINKSKEEGGCGGWCCQFQSPQVLSSEFINTWEYVMAHWDWEKIADLIEFCMRNYLSDTPMKGCVFWDSGTKLCKQHKTRPYNCRTYGIIPEEEFRPRYERLKKQYADRLDATIHDQCNLVNTVTGNPITMDQTNKWWKDLIEIESSIGVRKRLIHDGPGGTYLTYHDHILLRVCSDGIMGNLQLLRQHGNRFEKEQSISGLMQAFRKNKKDNLDQNNESDSNS